MEWQLRNLIAGLCVFALTGAAPLFGGQRASSSTQSLMKQIGEFRFATLVSAIEDFQKTHGAQYTDSGELLEELKRLRKQVEAAKADANTGTTWPKRRLEKLLQDLDRCKRLVLLSNPVLKDLEVLCVKRGWKGRVTPGDLKSLGIPSNHECHSSLLPLGYENEIARFRITDPVSTWTTLLRPEDSGWVGHLDLHWDADRLIFARSDSTQWNLFEMNVDGSDIRQITQLPPDVNCFDPCYLPDGNILCASDATGQCVPCWHGVARKSVANLFLMGGDGSNMRRLTFDQDHNIHPAVLSSGQIVYNRWDYTGINRVFLRPLMVMNPDGTRQRSLYGSNSWYPNGLYWSQELPGKPGQLLSILSGYHGPGRSGHLVVIDTKRGHQEADGIVSRISGRGAPLEIEYRDRLTEPTWPKFHSSFPITDKHFLVSGWMSENSRSMGIYLADIFDNLLLLHQVDDAALLEPLPIIPRATPPAIPHTVDPQRDDAVLMLEDIYVGPGLSGVPRGTIKRLRAIAYHFGYVGLAGNDKIGLSGPWDAMRILGTTPVESDGSAMFHIPANTPVAIQALDSEGKAVQLMRTWLSARPGEVASCVGCHESPNTAPVGGPSLAAQRPPKSLQPWYGPARGFDFAREVQPVLNRHCVGCHDGREQLCDLRPEEAVDDYRGRFPGRLDLTRMHDVHRSLADGRVRYTPAYEALVHFIRRVNVGDDVSILTPGYYHADTSELVQMLQKGHHGVQLSPEDWDRLVTWIDLNGPCHGTWGDVFDTPIPEHADLQRKKFFEWYGGPPDDPEWVPDFVSHDETNTLTATRHGESPVTTAEDIVEAAVNPIAIRKIGQAAELDLGDGLLLPLTKIPAGEFMMGDVAGLPDESPRARVTIEQPFWIGTGEISNAQLQRCLPSHDSGYYTKRHKDRYDDKGMSLREPSQPALKVSWHEAIRFCDWLSRQTGLQVSLPTEAQWEYACRAGRDSEFHYGDMDSDFAPFENMADKTFTTFGFTGKSVTGHFEIEGGIDYLVAEGVEYADRRFDDGICMTGDVTARQPNAMGVVDMHGNVAEWTLSRYRPYPYNGNDGRNDLDADGERVVRGGSYLDRPARCRSAARYSYPPWQKVYNVGFRVVVNQPSLTPQPSE